MWHRPYVCHLWLSECRKRLGKIYSGNLLTAVLAGQPVTLVGDLNADPTIILSFAKSIGNGHWIDVEQAFAIGRGVAPACICLFQLDEDEGSRKNLTLACPIAMAATTACCVLPDRWFTPHFAILTEFFALCMGRPLFIWPKSILLFDKPAGSIDLTAPDVLRLRRFRIFEMFTFVKSVEVRGQLFIAWCLWSREAEACLACSCLSHGWWSCPLDSLQLCK